MKIALNAGHCLKTPGKQSPDNYKEYNFNIAVVRKIETILKRYGLEIIICNPESVNEEYSLTKITEIANKAKADLFLSVHFNAMGNTWSSVRGLETYYYKSGKELAKIVHSYLILGQPMPDRGVKQANFTVLVKTNMPAILVECGFMDNKIDRMLMEMDEYRQECAEEITQGILKYLNIKYIPFNFKREEWIDILDKVSPWSQSVWVPFVKAHPEVNLKGLIVNIYKEGLNVQR